MFAPLSGREILISSYCSSHSLILIKLSSPHIKQEVARAGLQDTEHFMRLSSIVPDH